MHVVHILRMELKEWLKRNDMRVSEFARSIGKSHTTVLRWIDGTTTPSPKAMRLVMTKTHKRVMPSDFFPDQHERTPAQEAER